LDRFKGHTITVGISRPSGIEIEDLGTDGVLITEGQALVIAMGRPQFATTFGDFADLLVTAV